MHFVTLLLTIAISNFTLASSLISCNGFPVIGQQVASHVGNCHRAIAGMPVWRVDVGNAGANGRGTIILHPQVQDYRVPASFEHRDQISKSSCNVEIYVFRTQMVDGQPQSSGAAISLSAVALAFYVWNPAQHAASRVLDECLRSEQKLGMSNEFLTIPPVLGSPAMPIEINVTIKVEAFAYRYPV
ncbi:hypothetical protein MMC15_001509 [Xylographa vitiligo]|nr:hypothetical protein [Xylographa vitiligo]